VLADITVGYMGGEGEQWLIVRNRRGQELLDLLGDEVVLAAPGSAGQAGRGGQGLRREHVVRAAGGLPLRRMPEGLRRSWRGCSRGSAARASNSPARGSR
jgi:coenzyme F420 hydrogenase subunit beta